MNKVTYIIPLHTFNKEVQTYLVDALASVKAMEGSDGDRVMFVGPKAVLTKASKVYDLPQELTLVENNDSTDVFTQINKAVYQCVTPYFSVLEFDDKFYPYWNKEAQKYGTAYNASIVLPINELQINSAFVGFGNEIAWNASFMSENENGELGFIEAKTIESFMGFNLTGALISTEDFISLGGLKPSLKFAAWYEFMLRAAYNNKKMFVAPKVGYVHTIEREGSYSKTLPQTISAEEGQWLIQTAKQEYFFKEDRNRSFAEEASQASEAAEENIEA